MISRQKLYEIYNSLPKLECKGLCSQSCGPIEIAQIERENLGPFFKHKDIHDMMPHLLKKHKDDNDGCITCPMLKDNRCTVYDKRPLICRLWGLTEGMKCEWGCKPERYLTDAEARQLLVMVDVKKDTWATKG